MDIEKTIAKQLHGTTNPLLLALRKLRPIKSRNYNEIPQSKNQGEYIIIKDAIVGLESGLYLTPINLLIGECRSRHLNQPFLKRRDNGYMASCNNSCETLLIEAAKGTLVDIVEKKPDTENAREMALRIYAGITTQAEYPNFDRLKTKRI